MLDILVQSRRDAKAAKRFMAKLMKKQRRVPRVMVTDKLITPSQETVPVGGGATVGGQAGGSMGKACTPRSW